MTKRKKRKIVLSVGEIGDDSIRVSILFPERIKPGLYKLILVPCGGRKSGA